MDKTIYVAIAGLIPLLILSGCVSENKVEKTAVSNLTIGVKTFTLTELFMLCEEKKADKYSGVALDDVIKKAGLSDPDKHTYTVIASDGYQKTVKWEDMEEGVLTNESLAVFPHLPKMYWIRDVVEVKQNE